MRYNHFVEYLTTKQNEHKAVYIAGIKLTNSDIKYLLADAEDTKLLAELKSFNGSVKDFIQQRLITQHPEIVKESKPFMITHNLRSSRSIEEIVKQFEVNETNRIYTRSNQTTIHHTILAWNNKDAGVITDAMLRKMANQYIRLRGENNIYCITKHIDKENTTHLHVAMGATNLTGLSSRISKKEFSEIKLAMDSFQKEHYKSLNNSLPEHGKRQRNKEAEIKYIRHERTSILSNKLSCLDEIQEKSTSTTHFFEQLKAMNIEVYERGNKPTGVICDGYKFRFNKLGIDFEKLKALDVRQEQEKKQLDEIANLRIKGKDIEKVKDVEKSISLGNEAIKGSDEKALQELAELRDNKNDKDIDMNYDNDTSREITDDLESDTEDREDRETESDDVEEDTDIDNEDTEIDDSDDSDEPEN